MIKPFLTYKEQVAKLHSKNLIIDDEDKVANELMQKSYFSLIGGYKNPFRDPSTRQYVENTKFEDILSLYEFDDKLRFLFFKYLSSVETTIQSRLSYAFCEIYGENQEQYLNTCNYNINNSNRRYVNKLINKLEYEANC